MDYRFPLFTLFAGLLLGACDVSNSDAVARGSSTVLFVPSIELDSAVALPEVDSVRISIFLVRRPNDSLYYRHSVGWRSHGDTIRAIPDAESLLVRIEGVKLQDDSSGAVWWSGAAKGFFELSQDGGVRNLSVPVVVGDTVAPALISREGDTVAHAATSIHLAWILEDGCACSATIDDGDGIPATGDSVVWDAKWSSGRTRTVIASFRDRTGNLLIDTVVVVRREQVATPTFSIDEDRDGFPVVHIASATPDAAIEYSLDSGATWRGYGDSIVLKASVALHARATKEGMDASAVASQAVAIPAPVFSVPTGTKWDDFLVVKLASRIAGATLQYSTNGVSWDVYADSIVLGSNATLRARAIKDGAVVGDVATAIYWVQVATPTFSVNSGAGSEDILAIRLASTTPGATFEYSMDAGATWIAYRDSIVLGRSIQLEARASKPGLAISAVGTASYDISLPMPDFSVESGTSSNDVVEVRLSCRTPGASLEYSTNGLAWTTGDSLVLGASTQLWARAKKEGMEIGPVAKATYWIQAAKPVFSVNSGTSSRDLLTVRLEVATPDASIEYSLDSGTTWLLYRDSIVLGHSIELAARAFKPGLATSAIVYANYVISLPAPVFSVPTETKWNDLLSVKLTCPAAGAELQYSFDGVSWEIYRDSIVLGSNVVVWARAIKAGMAPGPTVTAAYWIQAESPTFSVKSDTRSDDLLAVRLASATPGAEFEYSLDSGTTWIAYRDSIVLGRSIILLARAFKANLLASAVASARYEISLPAPVFSVPSETIWNDIIALKLACSTPGASLQYSTDGVSWKSYDDSILLGSSTMMRARAVKAGMAPGAVASATYWIQAAAPTFSVNSGASVDHPLAVRLACSTPGASIEYSLDSGATWLAYVDSIVLGSSLVLDARASKPGLATSPTSYAVYDVVVATPTFSLPSGTLWVGSVSLALACVTSGATIQYSMDSVLWRNYTEPLVLTGSTYVWIRAIKDGVQTSPLAKALYWIQASASVRRDEERATADATSLAGERRRPS